MLFISVIFEYLDTSSQEEMGGFDDYKPVMAMVGLQFAYAGVAVLTRAALLQGMSPRVFVVYRQAIATLTIAPIAYFSRVTINQNIFFEGLYLASSSMASAMGNLVPAITFVLASILGLEKVNIGSMRSIAKIAGTVLCVCGAISMALLRGPKLLNAKFLPAKSFFESGENWLLGCIFLFGSACCWSVWLILQVPVSATYPDHLSSSAWMCFFATLQSLVLTLLIEQDVKAWIFHSPLQLACCLFAGTIGSGLAFFIQAWCISGRGPLFSAMFNPLCTVIVTMLAASFLHEEIHLGSLIGAVGVIIGLYIVLWGKAEDHLVDIREQKAEQPPNDHLMNVKVLMDGSSEKTSCKPDLEEPLMSDKPNLMNKSKLLS